MRQFILLSISCLLSVCLQAQNEYILSADSKTKDGVKYGEYIHTQFGNSKIFPGTERDVDVYIPAEYDGKSPACVCVLQDGMGYRADTVVSNLIADKELPMMIIVAASPGRVVGDFDPDSPRANRTYEYDTPSSRFGEFLLNELLPFVESLKTPSGKSIVLSKDRDNRMIAGCSSGAACAFNVAWSTDAFSRVYSSCGSFTGLRGSFTNATLVHKFEPKPIRFYLQSGTQDMWTSFGDWWSANQAMVRAMEFSGYDFEYKLTENAHHCDADVVQIFPEVMRFLWKGYPENKPTPKGKSRNWMMSQILLDGEEFELVSDFRENKANLLSGANGKILLATSSLTYAIEEGQKTPVLNKRVLAEGVKGEMLSYDSKKGLSIVGVDGKIVKAIKEKIYPYNAVALRSGGYYIVGAKSKGENPQYLWLLSKDGVLTELDKKLKGARALALSANDNWLYVFEYDTRRGFNYKVNRGDLSLSYKQEFFFIHLPDECDGAETASAISDDFGRTYLATAYGVQVCDYNGRSEVILPLSDNAQPVSIAWGDDLSVLYVLCDNGKLYKRKLNTKGASIYTAMPQVRVGAG